MKYLLIIAIILGGCTSADTKKDAPAQQTSTQATKGKKQINLTILLDLSDRIDPRSNPSQPQHFERDSTLISYLTDYFLRQMTVENAYATKGKIRVIFHPNPPDPGINLAAKKLNIDLSDMEPKEKKTVYKTLAATVAENIGNIYKTTISQAQWPGSDIWRFFKNDVKDVAVDSDTTYRNILVVFTDGYIYHQDSKDNDANRYAYILPGLFDKYNLRKDKKWSETIDKLDFGLISKRDDLNQLEVLVLEVAPSPENRNDEDIIRKVLDKWFSEMKVKRWKIINSDLPESTQKKIHSFLES
ncbi:hypothetical protein KTO58_19130 [Chitinophaga pendula]|uniref:hypothetical protein n=1 Tax=Chitinophaga TaxID=79328 RepID=UPI000BB0ACAA|nr:MULTISPECIES: hypothetical protein [Chitinophaga]ASZ11214.1 hypothetical protein CK934_09680 [Chitinophaga sp. MD30]UCJ05789.1 hypothetical protein KTO58_19130 [Chitinophaga pendula]